MKKEKLNCKSARNISITEVLRKLEHFPKKESEKEAQLLNDDLSSFSFQQQTILPYNYTSVKKLYIRKFNQEFSQKNSIELEFKMCVYGHNLAFSPRSKGKKSVYPKEIFKGLKQKKRF